MTILLGKLEKEICNSTEQTKELIKELKIFNSLFPEVIKLTDAIKELNTTLQKREETS